MLLLRAVLGVSVAGVGPVLHAMISRAAPEGMLRAPAHRGGRPGEETFEFPAYWVDRYEVSNRQFMGFVDGGGYENRDFWRFEFVPLMLISSTTDYLASLGMYKTDDRMRRRMLLSISLFVNLGLLFVFKYLVFFAENVLAR